MLRRFLYEILVVGMQPSKLEVLLLDIINVCLIWHLGSEGLIRRSALCIFVDIGLILDGLRFCF